MAYSQRVTIFLTTTLLLAPVSFASLAAVPPNYTPLFVADFNGGTVGGNVTEFYAITHSGRTIYSDDITGPFDSGTVVKELQTFTGQMFFGAEVIQGLNLGEGDELWIRIYHYFPNDFCFGYWNIVPPASAADGWGGTKWYRMEFANHQKFELELGGAYSGNVPTAYHFKNIGASESCPSEVAFYGAVPSMSEVGFVPAFDDVTNAFIGRGRWVAIQAHIIFSEDPGTGMVEGWIDDTYLGEQDFQTLPTGSHSSAIFYGNYWNGGAPAEQHWYYDEAIITTEQPNTLDSGGRPYIDPNTKAADFSSSSARPSAPTNVQVH